MTRLYSMILCAAVGVGLVACGSNSTGGAGGTGGGVGSGGAGSGSGGAAGATGVTSILDLVPLDSSKAGFTLSGWAVTTDPNAANYSQYTVNVVAATATTEKATEGLIDGAAADFFAAPNAPTEFAWQNYVSSTVADAPNGATVILYVLQSPSADLSKGLYTSLLSASLYSRKKGTPNDWQDPSSPLLGTDSRIQNTGTDWWINFYKGNYYVEVDLNPSAGPDLNPSDNTKAEAFRFAQAIASKL